MGSSFNSWERLSLWKKISRAMWLFRSHSSGEKQKRRRTASFKSLHQMKARLMFGGSPEIKKIHKRRYMDGLFPPLSATLSGCFSNNWWQNILLEMLVHFLGLKAAFFRENLYLVTLQQTGMCLHQCLLLFFISVFSSFHMKPWSFHLQKLQTHAALFLRCKRKEVEVT